MLRGVPGRPPWRAALTVLPRLSLLHQLCRRARRLSDMQGADHGASQSYRAMRTFANKRWLEEVETGWLVTAKAIRDGQTLQVFAFVKLRKRIGQSLQSREEI